MTPTRITLTVREPEPITLHVREVVVTGLTQTKEVTPDNIEQRVLPDPGLSLAAVIVHPIPQNYGLITWNGAVLTVS